MDLFTGLDDVQHRAYVALLAARKASEGASLEARSAAEAAESRAWAVWVKARDAKQSR